MSAKFIIDQNRDIIIPFDPNAWIYITDITVDDVYYGMNLMYNSICLGTFEKPSQAVKEVSAIYNCTDELYAIDGYSVGGFNE